MAKMKYNTPSSYTAEENQHYDNLTAIHINSHKKKCLVSLIKKHCDLIVTYNVFDTLKTYYVSC